jgi:Calcineurin-like phosphoesterase
MNKITLIIPDIHHKWHHAEKIISSVGADEIIFLGDYFDDFNDAPEMVQETADWLVSSVNKPNRIHLFGNHDIHYAYTYRNFKSSGYEQWKNFIIQDTVSQEVWNKLKYYHFLDNRWLLTHAGLHKANVPGSILKLKTNRKEFIAELSGHLDYSIIEGFKAAANNVPHWIFCAGGSRGGRQPVGGITWCDFEREFSPIEGINQIMGHTPCRSGCAKWCFTGVDGSPSEFNPTVEQLDNPNASANLNLDVLGNMHYGIWDGKKFIIGNYREL